MIDNQNKEKLFIKKDAIFFLIFLFVFLFLFKSFFFTNSTFYVRDTTLVEIPTRKLCTELYQGEGIPLWTESYGNGQPFLANPKHAVFYPSTLLYLFLSFFTAFKLHYFIHVIIGWLGIYYLSKSFSLSQIASFLSATVFMLSGMFLSSFEFYNHVAALCWMPWILLLLNRPVKKMYKKILVMSVFWALMILAGTPYVIIMTIIIVLLHIVFLENKKKNKIAFVSLSLIFAVLISSVQLLPSIEMLSQSDRNPQKKTMWSLELIQLSNLVFPNILGNDRDPEVNHFWGAHLFDKQYPLYYSFYIGFGVILLFCIGLKKPRDKKHIFFGATFLIFFILAAGRYLPFYTLITKIPPFSFLRYPVKYFMGCLFSLTMLSAVGFDRLFHSNKLKKKPAVSIISISLILLILFALFKNTLLKSLSKIFVIDNSQIINKLEGYLWQGLWSFFIFSALIFLFLLLKIKPKIFGFLFLILVIIDLLLVNGNINPVTSTSFFAKPDYVKSEKREIKIYRENHLPYDVKENLQKSIQYHNYLRQSLCPFCGLGYDIQFLFNRDFYGVYDKEYHDVFDTLESLPKEKLKMILEKTGCDYYIGHHPLPGTTIEKKTIEEYEVFFQKLAEKQNQAYLVYDTIKKDNIEKKIELILEKDFNPHETAVIEKDIELEKSRGENPNKITVINSESCKKKYLINTNSEAIAVVPGNYHPGWKAWIDGKKTEVFKVNLASKGIMIPPGEHEVELKYFPSSFLYGIIISLFSVFTILLSLLISIKKKRIDK